MHFKCVIMKLKSLTLVLTGVLNADTDFQVLFNSLTLNDNNPPFLSH